MGFSEESEEGENLTGRETRGGSQQQRWENPPTHPAWASGSSFGGASDMALPCHFVADTAEQGLTPPLRNPKKLTGADPRVEGSKGTSSGYGGVCLTLRSLHVLPTQSPPTQ
jgi:hypothetical protein